MEERLKKILQKRFYDLLSHKNGILMMLAGVFLLVISAFHFGEALLEWSQDKYESVFHSYSDNIAQKNFRDRLSTTLPIDVVYTWVNGSDPDLIRELERIKVAPSDNSNATRQARCPYTNCVCVGLLLSPPLPSTITLDDLKLLKSTSDSAQGQLLFSNVTRLKEIRQQSDWPGNFTQLDLPTEHDVTQILSVTSNHWYHDGVNYTINKAFYTSDLSLRHGITAPSVVMMSGYPSRYAESDIKTSVSTRVNDTVKFPIEVNIYQEQGISLLFVTQTAHYSQLTKDTGLTIEGKTVMFNQVKLVWSLQQDVKDDVVAANRFEDNEELRYSLRSIEKYAPWVRHIFLVTNGQIPYWLNLDSPRLTVVTHDDIFQNKSHLPSFSSPAIEAHIHQIPGLSDQFIYMNDDVMFGRPVWPDDFYTQSSGQKVYLTWPVPNCNEGCPSTWIKDGYCDKACNSSECEWDGGDCLGGNAGSVQYGVGFHGQSNLDTTSYCATGCADSWLSDKYCDQACNVLECGFDTGDCGTQNYHQFYGIDLDSDKHHYKAPPGENLIYFNLTELVGAEGKVSAAKAKANKAVRVASVANKFKVMTLVLHPGHNATTVTLSLEYNKGTNTSLTLNISVDVNTSVARQEVQVLRVNESGGPTTESVDVADANVFTGWVNNQKNPSGKAPHLEKLQTDDKKDNITDILYKNYKAIQGLSEPLKKQLEDLEHAFEADELTIQGFKFKLNKISTEFSEEIESLTPKLAELKQSRPDDGDKAVQSEGRGQAEGAEQVKQQHVQPQLQLQDLQQSQGIQKLQDLQGSLGVQHGNQEKQPGNPQKSQDHLQQSQGLQHQNNHKPKTEDGVKDNLWQGQDKQLLEQQQQLLTRKKLQRQSLQAKERKEDVIDPPIAVDSRIKRNQTANPKSPIKSKFRNVGGENPPNVKEHQGRGQKDVKITENDPGNENIQGDGKDSPYGVGDKGAGGRKLLSSFFDRLVEMGEDQQHRARAKMRQEETMMSDEDFLKLVNVGEAQGEGGHLPWEREQKFEKETEREPVANEYIVEGWQGRQLLDTFGDSLRHVNSLYNKEFGFAPRKVPAHMPHFIDKNIMKELQDRFPKQWEETSSHQIRHSADMQYSFSYFYYLMGVTEEIPVENVFDDMDTDMSGVLSDREIRTLATRLYDLPLYLETLTGLEDIFKNCSHKVEDETAQTLPESAVEVYYDKELPQITKKLLTTCDLMTELVKEKFKPRPKYKTVEMNDEHITFKMIHTNVSHVVGQLDDVRKNPKKFICLNDNIEHSRDEAKTVKAVLQDFYESMFPKQSQFELQREYRNRFLHMDDLREWRTYRDRLRLFTHVALSLLILLTAASFFGDKIESWRHRLALRRTKQQQCSSSSESSSSTVQDECDGRATPPSSISTSGSSLQAANHPDSDSCMLWPGQSPIDTV